MLNIYMLIWFHCSCFFIILDLLFVPPNHVEDIIIHSLSLSILSFLLFLNKKRLFDLSRVLFLSIAFLVFYYLAFVIAFSPYTICYFIFIPMMALSIYKSNKPAYLFLIICITIYSWSDLWLQEITDTEYRIRLLILLKDPVVTSFFLASFYLFYYFKKLNQQNEKKLEIAYKKLEESKKAEIAHLQLKSLKSQMNPHFIFNALNSIQEYILSNQKDLASDYLGKFADLIRNYLHFSNAESISITEEIRSLNLYLELEKLRFEEKLQYSLNIDKNLNFESIKIPTMLIQPYVENALKHGLLHKKDNRLLKITIFKEDGNTIKCIIEDNGVGRKKSQEINQKRAKFHKSFATKATAERLTLLNLKKNNKIGVEIIDLIENNNPSGTRVVLKIPIIKNESINY